MVVFNRRIVIGFLSLGILASLCFFLINRSVTYVELPIGYSLTGVPTVNAKINKKTVKLEVDTGSKYPLLIKEIFVKTLDTSEAGAVTTRDALGNKYPKKFYSVPDFELGSIKVSSVHVYPLSKEEENNHIIWQDASLSESVPIVGLLGRPVLENWNILFDFPANKMVLFKGSSNFNKNGYSLHEFNKLKVDITPLGIVFNCHTDLGCLRLLLDTGFTTTCIKSDLLKGCVLSEDWRHLSYFKSKLFQLGEKKYSSKKFYSFPFSAELTSFDGILGMDFLRDHIVYIDQKNSVIYIK